jgi:hypothetical protein
LLAASVLCTIFNAVAVVSSFNALVVDINVENHIIFGQGGGRVKGVPYLMVRIGELRSHQLIEATVRAYCIRHERHAITIHHYRHYHRRRRRRPETPRT